MEGVILIYLLLPKNIIFSGHLLAPIVDFDISDTPFQIVLLCGFGGVSFKSSLVLYLDFIFL